MIYRRRTFFVRRHLKNSALVLFLCRIDAIITVRKITVFNIKKRESEIWIRNRSLVRKASLRIANVYVSKI